MIPASNQKLLVAAVALEMLGADFRFTTASRRAAAGRRRDRRRCVPRRRRRSAADVVGLPDRRRQRAGDQRDDVRPARRRAGQRPASPGSTARCSATAAGTTTSTRSTRWGEGVAGVEAGPYDALMVNDSRALGRSGSAARSERGRGPRTRPAARRPRGHRRAADWGVGVADPAAAEIASIQSATARCRRRRDAHHERRQHRRDAAQGVGHRRHRHRYPHGRPERARPHAAVVGGADGRRASARRIGPQPREPGHLRGDPRRARSAPTARRCRPASRWRAGPARWRGSSSARPSRGAWWRRRERSRTSRSPPTRPR